MASKLCDSCKSATAALFCRADSAFLCLTCDSKIHAAASHHARVWVCEQAPAHVTCKADAAALCAACDRDIHTANPLARRHDRVPVTPFYDTAVSSSAPSPKQQQKHPTNNLLDDRCFDSGDADVSREEAEAASWLLPNPPNKVVEGSAELNAGQFLFPEMMGPYLDLDYGPLDPKVEAQEHNSSAADGVVPVQSKTNNCFELDFSGSKSFPYTPYTAASTAAQSLSHSVAVSHQLSSSSLEVGVVPDGSDISNPYSRTGGGGTESTTAGNNQPAQQLSAVDREARVLRYREKRKNRKFEKTSATLQEKRTQRPDRGLRVGSLNGPNRKST